MTDLGARDAEQLTAPLPVVTGGSADAVADAWAEHARTGDGGALGAALRRICGGDE